MTEEKVCKVYSYLPELARVIVKIDVILKKNIQFKPTE